ncbi:MAG: YfiR family protein [Desulfuromonadales bacterium]
MSIARVYMYRTCTCLILLFSLCICPGVQADGIRPSESNVKSAMLFNMIKFVDWPQGAISADSSPITVCVLGKGPFGAALDALHGENLKGRAVIVRHINQVQEAGNCQILVVGDVDRRAVTSIIEWTRQQPILTVSDLPNFAQAGGVVGFIEQEGKIRFVINITAAQQQKIRINSLLLKIARIVQDPS